MKDAFLVKGLGGKRTLEGTIRTNGAKNASLKLFAATLLFEGAVTLKRVPEIEDTNRMVELLGALGAHVVHDAHGEYTITPGDSLGCELPQDVSERFRSSIVVAGPLLGRMGRAVFYFPGGCVIGKRPIDFFVEGFEAMGTSVSVTPIAAKDGAPDAVKYLIEVPGGKLRGAEIFLRAPSVTATETFIMAALLAEGETVIKNAAMEPEIVSLGEYLKSCGGDIEGVGTPTVRVRGGRLLLSGGRPYVTLPDRIEAGSYIILAALAAKDVTIADCNPAHLDALLAVFKHAGVQFEKGADFVRVRASARPYRAFSIKTQGYPGFPTDLQALAAVFLTQAEGEGTVFETIFESRLAYLEDLKKMGAHIHSTENQAFVNGPSPLKGGLLTSTDLRAGMAFLIAAIVATGESTIKNIYTIDRGYEKVEEKLRALGASVERV